MEASLARLADLLRRRAGENGTATLQTKQAGGKSARLNSPLATTIVSRR